MAGRSQLFRRPNALVAAVAILGVVLAGAADCSAQTERAGARSRGIAVLSSSIGDDVTPEELEAFVRTCGIDLVVIDFAWITYHWPRTKLDVVNQLASDLEAEGVRVAAMYRPRLLHPSEADVHLALDASGRPAEHHNHLCFAHEDSVQWGASWGERILRALPTVDTVILYNVLTPCQCPECRDGHGRAHAAAFIRHCRERWRGIRPDVLVGHVGLGDEYAQCVDLLMPFISVNTTEEGPIDPAQEVERVHGIATSHRETPVVPLLKTCWASATNNSTEDITHAIEQCTRSDLGFVLWYYEWLFHSETERYDAAAIAQAVGGEWSGVATAPSGRLPRISKREEGNDPRSWIAFDSREAASARGPRLKLVSRDRIETIPASADATLISYLAGRAWGGTPHLAISLSDTNRTLVRFDVPTTIGGADIERAELILEMTESPLPAVAPFDLAVHVVREAWREREVKWTGQPAWEDEACAVVSIEPEPGPVRMDITSAVRAWSGGRIANHGLLLKVHEPLAPGDSLGGGPNVPDLPITPVSLEDVLAQRALSITLVKDFLRMRNTGEEVTNVEFERYFPVVDDEQIILGRWMRAQRPDGSEVPITIASVDRDGLENLIHTYRLTTFPGHEDLVVAFTTLVARREHAPPDGRFPIPERAAYPQSVQPYLSATTMVASRHPIIEQQAEELLAQSDDALEVARALAGLMKGKSYAQEAGADMRLPTAPRVLRHGGSCCGSAVCAAAVLRACGIPARLTYAPPPSFLHGVVEFYLNGYGWVRMDSTCGVGKLPLMQERQDLGLVRLYTMPIEMERIEYAYAWPYMHNDLTGRYEFSANSRPCTDIEWVGGELIAEPFRHWECGSWNAVLGSEPYEGPWRRWSNLERRSLRAIDQHIDGEFTTVTEVLPSLRTYFDVVDEFE